jgi:hypothetical protein
MIVGTLINLSSLVPASALVQYLRSRYRTQNRLNRNHSGWRHARFRDGKDHAHVACVRRTSGTRLWPYAQMIRLGAEESLSR